MPLCLPIITGRVSELTKSVHITGQLPGAKVKIFVLAEKKLIGEGDAGSGDQYFDLFPTSVLKANQVIGAIQEFGGTSSAFPTFEMGVQVQPGPRNASDLGAVRLETHLYECSQYIKVSKVFPGATVEVRSQSVILGSAPAPTGIARLSLEKGLPMANTDILVRQTANVPDIGPLAGPDTTQKTDPIPFPRPHLPAPVITGPFRQCDKSVPVSGALEGATVTIRRGSGKTEETAGFDKSTLSFILSEELKEGEALAVKQNVYLTCERSGVWSAPEIMVEPLGTIDPPIIEEPVCKGQHRLRLKNLRPGSLVRISANNEVYLGAAPKDASQADFDVPAIFTDTITATQEVCGIASQPCAPVEAHEHADTIPPVRLLSPIYRCAYSVSIDSIHPGSIIQIIGKDSLGLTWWSSEKITVYSTEATIEVPALVEGMVILVKQVACNGSVSDSNKVTVEVHHGDLLPPEILPNAKGGDQQVQLYQVVPGAVAEIYISRDNKPMIYAGKAVGNLLCPNTWVPLNLPVVGGDILFSRQTLCPNQPSKFGGAVSVHADRGPGPRPFYLIGHNTNSINQVNDTLVAGGNALEPDVNIYQNDHGKLCISHGKGEDSAPSLTQFLDDLHARALLNPQLSLVVFDCKEGVAMPEFGLTILREVRNRLTYDTGINIIISVAKIDHGAIFDIIRYMLGPREGVMIDEENDPIAVSNYFLSKGISNQAFGNGIYSPDVALLDEVTASFLGPNVRPSLEQACAFKASMNRLKFTYGWTINETWRMNQFIGIGVDGLITDDIPELLDVVKQPEYAKLIRIADTIDNPMNPGNYAYGLTVHTADRSHAGTDSNIKFTVEGSLGSAWIIIDSYPPHRMESDEWNYITLPSPDLGTLQTVTINKDDSGNAPDWYLDKVIVESYRYQVSKTAVFNREIDDDSAFSAPLL